MRPIIAGRPLRARHPGRRRARGAARPRALHGRALRAEDGGDHAGRSSSGSTTRRSTAATTPRCAPRSARDDLPRIADATLAAARERVAAAPAAHRRRRAARRPRHRPRHHRLLRHARARTPRRSCAGRATSSRTSSSTSATSARRARPRARRTPARCARTSTRLIAARRARDRRPATSVPDDVLTRLLRHRPDGRRPARHRDPPQPHRPDRRLDPDRLEGVRRASSRSCCDRPARARARAARGARRRSGARRRLRVRGAALPPADVGAAAHLRRPTSTVAAGHRARDRRSARARRVLVATQSAMFDERAVSAPRRVPRRPAVERLPALRRRAAHVLRPADQPRPPPRAGHGAARGPADRARCRGRREAALRRPVPLGPRRLAGPTVEVSAMPVPTLITFPPSLDSEFSRFLLHPLRHRASRGAPRDAVHLVYYHARCAADRRASRCSTATALRLDTVKKIIDHFEPLRARRSAGSCRPAPA